MAMLGSVPIDWGSKARVTQLRNAEVCRLVKVDTKANLADPFTKMFTGDEHARLRELYMFEQKMPVSAGAP